MIFCYCYLLDLRRRTVSERVLWSVCVMREDGEFQEMVEMQSL
jgi:hypothetical protein